jgi:hypothetical protein
MKWKLSVGLILGVGLIAGVWWLVEDEWQYRQDLERLVRDR